MTNCDNYAIDSHIYQAWAWENPVEWFQQHACEDKERLVEMEAMGNVVSHFYSKYIFFAFCSTSERQIWSLVYDT